MMCRTFLMIGFLALTGCAPARAGMTVYMTDGLARVRPDDPPVVAPSILIRAARNEYEPFQVIIHAGPEGLTGVSASAGDLRSQDGVINATNLTYYREQYVHVTKRSPRS